MYLYGAGGHAKVIIDILNANNEKVDALFDDNETIHQLFDYPVLRTNAVCGPLIISIGNNGIRKKVSDLLSLCFGIAKHPSAIISKNVEIGEGSVVMQGAVIQSSTKIGRHCIINTSSCIDHECIIDDFVHISPHSTLCGNVMVGEGSWIGAGTVIIPNVKIGKWSVIGAGSVVTENIPDNVLALGNRCKIIKKLD